MVVGTVNSELEIVDFEQSLVETVVVEVAIDEVDSDLIPIDHEVVTNQDAVTECYVAHDQVTEIVA